MHLLRTVAGGFVDDNAGVVRIDQQPADIVVMSSADTTLSLLASVIERLGPGFPSVRLVNLAYLRQPASVDFYLDDVLQHARVVVIDHLGGESYWPYGIEQIGELARRKRQMLVMFSGDLQEDPNLIAKSTASGDVCRLLWRYLREGGPRNAEAFMRAIAWHAFGWDREPPPPAPLPAATLYHPALDTPTIADWQTRWRNDAPVVALLFYRAHLQAANTAVFDALIDALEARRMNVLPIAVTSLKDAVSRDVVGTLCARHEVSLVLNTTAFAASAIDDAEPQALAGDAPVLQVILSGGNREDWVKDNQGLHARDIAMHVALPEVDGRIVTRAVSFKGLAYRCARTQVDVVRYRGRRRTHRLRGRAEPALVPVADAAERREETRARAGELPDERWPHRQWSGARYARVGRDDPLDAARGRLRAWRCAARRRRRADTPPHARRNERCRHACSEAGVSELRAR